MVIRERDSDQTELKCLQIEMMPPKSHVPAIARLMSKKKQLTSCLGNMVANLKKKKIVTSIPVKYKNALEERTRPRRQSPTSLMRFSGMWGKACSEGKHLLRSIHSAVRRKETEKYSLALKWV